MVYHTDVEINCSFDEAADIPQAFDIFTGELSRRLISLVALVERFWCKCIRLCSVVEELDMAVKDDSDSNQLIPSSFTVLL